MNLHIKDIVMEKIKAGEVTMQPRWHFALMTMLFAFGAVFVALISVYLLSFVFFVLYKTGLSAAPSFGLMGVIMFVTRSPWLIISVVLLLLVVLYLLVRHFSFSYRRPLLYSILGITTLVLIVSGLVHYSMMHERVRLYAENHNVPGVARFYREQSDRRPPGITVGVIGVLKEREFSLIREDSGENERVLVTDATKLPWFLKLTLGQRVIVFGDDTPEGITAFGVKVIDVDERLPSHHKEDDRERPQK